MAKQKTQIKAINAVDVPKEIRRFSPAALAADTYNVGVVIVGMAALLVAVIVIAGSCNGCSLNGIGSNGESKSPPDFGDSKIINDVMKTTKIDYQSYLLSEKQLGTGESAEGILLFHVKTLAGLKDYKLSLIQP